MHRLYSLFYVGGGRILLVVDPGADSILMEVRKAVSENTDDVYEFELKAVEALLSVSSKRLVRGRRGGRRGIGAITGGTIGFGSFSCWIFFSPVYFTWVHHTWHNSLYWYTQATRYVYTEYFCC